MRRAAHERDIPSPWVADKRFVRDVGTVILACGTVLWVLLHVPSPGAPRRPPPHRHVGDGAQRRGLRGPGAALAAVDVGW